MVYSEYEKEYIIRNYPFSSNESIGAAIGRTKVQIDCFAVRRGLKKTDARRSEANSKMLIVRYDNGRVFIGNGRNVARELKMHYGNIPCYIGKRIISRKCRIIRYTDSHYGAFVKEYRSHPKTDTIIWPLWFQRQRLAPASKKNTYQKNQH